MALKTAALRGLDVRLMVTGVADKKIPYWAAFTFFRDLMRAGVKIYHYNRGLMHSKTIVLDDQISTVGTANMDSRSFFLNYELNALMYDKKTAIKLRDDFLEDLKYSKRLYLSDYNSFNIFVRIRNSLARLFSPIL
jgi:cardiolipin synthase